MYVVSVMSIAGGTGVTTVTSEIFDDLLSADKRVLAVDLGANQALERASAKPALNRVGDASALINPNRRMDFGSRFIVPHAGLLSLPKGKKYEDCCSPDLFAKVPIGDVFGNLEDRLKQLARFYDACVIDLSQAYPELMRLLLPFSDEVRFCEREVPEGATWKDFEKKYLSLSPARPNQTLLKYADRGNLAGILM